MLLDALPFQLVVTFLLPPICFGFPSPPSQLADSVSSPRFQRTIPLLHHARAERSPSWLRNSKLALETKYSAGSPRAKRNSGSNFLTNQNLDSSYFGTLAVGSPPVSYNVILDTGSSDLWLASSEGGAEFPQGIRTFDPTASQSYVELNTSFSIHYGSGQAEGHLGTDVVQMAGFEVHNQTFGVVTNASQGMLDAPVSGILGLAFTKIAVSGAVPFWETLAKTPDILDEPLMGIQLSRYINHTGAKSAEPGGTFTLGAVNASLFTGDIDYQPIPSGQLGYWILELTSITSQSTELDLPPPSSSRAAIDTGTTLVGGPATIIAEIFAQIPGSAPGTGVYEGFYTYPCKTQAVVSLGFGNSTNQWAVSPADFQVTKLSDETCVGAFFELSSSGSWPDWIIGDTFLKNVYSVFRAVPPSVGFATLSSTAQSFGSDTNGALPTPSYASAALAITAGPLNHKNSASLLLQPSLFAICTFWTIIFAFVHLWTPSTVLPC